MELNKNPHPKHPKLCYYGLAESRFRGPGINLNPGLDTNRVWRPTRLIFHKSRVAICCSSVAIVVAEGTNLFAPFLYGTCTTMVMRGMSPQVPLR